MTAALFSRRPLASYVRALFAAGEQGVWYDPSDMSTLYQDTAGQTPVTAVGQPVGLMLDKRSGLARGPELVANGGFATAVGWTTSAGWDITGGRAVATALAATNLLTSTTNLVAGKTYEIKYKIATYGTGGVSINIGPWAGGQSGVGRTAAGTYSELITATVSGLLSFARRFSDFAGSIDDVSVRELLGNHASQPTATSRPTLSARYNLLTNTESFSAAIWDKGTNVVVLDNTPDAAAPDGTFTATKLTSPATSGATYVRQVFTIPLTAHVGRVYVKKGNHRYFGLRVLNNDIGTTDYVVLDMDANGGAGAIVLVPPTENVSYSFSKVGDWYHFVVTNLPNATTRYFQVAITDAAGLESPTISAGSYVYVWHPDLRPANDSVGLPTYQRVVDAANYDAVGFPPYLLFDGVDDWLSTASVDFTATDKMAVFTAVRKLSDATQGVILELSPNAGSNAGSFALYPPGSAVSSYTWRTNISATVDCRLSTFAAPSTDVLTLAVDVAQSVAANEVKPLINGIAPTVSYTGAASLGDGNFGNYPLYLARRAGASLPFNGRLYGLIIRGAASSAARVSKVGKYLGQKSGVPL